MINIDTYREVQAIAKAVLAELGATICAQDTERTITDRAIQFLAKRGITETWYHNCPAFVLLGSRSCLSISGRDYVASDEPVGNVNLVTVDLSPSRDGVWGDCARSFYILGGDRACRSPRRLQAWRSGRSSPASGNAGLCFTRDEIF